MKAIVKLSVGCVALTVTLSAMTAFAGPDPCVSQASVSAVLFGQTAVSPETTSRQQSDGWLRQARQAMKEGKLAQAEYYIERAERLNVKYDELFTPLVDTPDKVRRDVAALKARPSVAGVMPQTPEANPPVDPQNTARMPAAPSQPSTRATLRFADNQAAQNPGTTQPGTFQPDSKMVDRLPPVLRRPVASPSKYNDSVAKTETLRLTAQARAALGRGDIATAQQLSEQALLLNVPASAFAENETRPWEVMLEVQAAAKTRTNVIPAGGMNASLPAAGRNGQYPVAQGLYSPRQDRTQNLQAQAQLRTTPQATAPSQGWQLYNDGLRALENQDRTRALELFRDAWQYQHELDPGTRGQLRDKLQIMGAPGRTESGNPPSTLDAVGIQQDLLRQKLFREITAEQKAAEEQTFTDPKGALERMETLRDRVNQAEVDPSSRMQLLTLVDRSIVSLQNYIEQNRTDIELKERNTAVLDDIDRKQKEKLDMQDKMAELIEEFNELVDEERYAEAETIASQVRELNPESPIARTLILKSKIIRRRDEQIWLRDGKEEGFYGAMASADQSAIPFDDRVPIDFGDIDRWQQLTNDRLRMLESQRRQLSPAEKEIQEALNRPVEVSFSNAPLKEVLETLGQVVNINIYPDPMGLAGEGVTSDQPVTINLTSPISLKSALKIILGPLRLSYVIQNEVLLVTSEQTRDSNVYPRVYNVADLVIPIPNFVPGYNVGLPAAIQQAHRDIGYGGFIQPVSMAPLTIAANDRGQNSSLNPNVLAQANGGYGDMGRAATRPSQPLGLGQGSAGGAAMADFDTLIELITSTIAPDSWDAVGGPGAIESFPTNLSLVISQTQDVHDQIADLLEQLRRLQDLQVTIEVRFITLRDDWYERMGIDFDFDIDDNVTQLPRDDEGPSTLIGLDQDGLPTSDLDLSFTQGSFGTAVPQFGGFDAATAANFGFAILSDIEVFFLLQAAQADQRSNVLQAPKVTLFNGQLASVNDTSQRPFVTSLVPVVGDFAAAHQPVVVVLSEGTSLSVQAVVSSDHRFVRLTLVPFFSQIGDVDTFTFDGKTTTNTGTNVTDPDGNTTGDVNNAVSTTEGTTVQLPTFSFTTVSTTVSVPDGGTVLLGGIKRLREGRNEEGIPMLSKLPYVNRLFKNVGIGRETQSLMLMVTPRIIIQEEEEQRLGIDLQP